MKIGITGQQGFIGINLTNYLKNKLEIIPFEKEIFLYEKKLDEFVEQCDTIVHLAGMSKNNKNEKYNGIELFNDNMNLAYKLIHSLNKTNSKAHLIFTSSIHENSDNYYAQSKKQIRELFDNWAKTNKSKYTGIILSNCFGEYAQSKYSFIATFCNQLLNNEKIKIFKDLEIGLIYIGELVEIFYDIIINQKKGNPYIIKPTSKNKISEILNKLIYYNIKKNLLKIDIINNKFDKNLYNTFMWHYNEKLK